MTLGELADAVRAGDPHVTAEVLDVIQKLSDTREVARRYEDWYQDCPEDSWRLQRDLFAALGIEPSPGE